MIPKGITDLKWRLGIALVLGAILALVLSASAAAAPAFPKTLGGKASASGNVGSAGRQEGADCRGGGSKAIIKAGAQMQNCPLAGADLRGAFLFRADLSGADLKRAKLRREQETRGRLPPAPRSRRVVRRNA